MPHPYPTRPGANISPRRAEVAPQRRLWPPPSARATSSNRSGTSTTRSSAPFSPARTTSSNRSGTNTTRSSAPFSPARTTSSSRPGTSTTRSSAPSQGSLTTTLSALYDVPPPDERRTPQSTPWWREAPRTKRPPEERQAGATRLPLGRCEHSAGVPARALQAVVVRVRAPTTDHWRMSSERCVMIVSTAYPRGTSDVMAGADALCSEPGIVVLRALPGVGDLLCAVPALRALRAAYPHAELTLAGLPSGAWDGRHGHLRRLPAYDGGLPHRHRRLRMRPRPLAWTVIAEGTTQGP
jgi:hypothetical protein